MMGYENPVLIKELRAKFRPRQAKALQWVVGGVSSLFVVWVYYQALSYFIQYPTQENAQSTWQAIGSLECMLIWIICPSLASNAITQEREQQTWESLVFTRLTSGQIVLGKFLARCIPLLAILVVFFPLNFICFAYDGISFSTLLAVQVCLLLWGMSLVAISLFYSWTCKRTATSNALAYVTLMILAVGTALVEATVTAGSGSTGTVITWINPVRMSSVLLFPSSDPDSRLILLTSTAFFAYVMGVLLWRMKVKLRIVGMD